MKKHRWSLFHTYEEGWNNPFAIISHPAWKRFRVTFGTILCLEVLAIMSIPLFRP